jgi:FlaA1/EpsC-like NDP-sugar epimerase
MHAKPYVGRVHNNNSPTIISIRSKDNALCQGFGKRNFVSSQSSYNCDLKGKRVLITGSTSGIGLSLANSFASQGCSIMLNGLGKMKVKLYNNSELRTNIIGL